MKPFRAILLPSFLLVASQLMGTVEIMPTDGRNVYRLTVAELGGDKATKEIVGSTYDNRVCAFTGAGKPVWDASIGGFAFDLAAGDVDGDGRDEIAVACADGFVYLLSASGAVLWKQDLSASVYQVAVARLDGKTPVVLATGVSREIIAFSAKGERLASAKINGAGRMLRAGDFDGDGADEVAVIPIRGSPQDLFFFKGDALKPIASGAGKKGKQSRNDEQVKTANGTVADLDGDGAAELIQYPGAVSLKGGRHQVAKLPDDDEQGSYDTYYAMRMFAAGDLTDSAGAEIVTVEANTIRLFDQKGALLSKASAPIGFTDVVYQPGQPHGSIVLGSSPNGGDNLYRITFEPGWEKAVQGIVRQGAMARIGDNLQQVVEASASLKGTPMTGADGPFDIIVNHRLWSGYAPSKFANWIAEVKAYERQFPFERLRFATCFWPGENAPLLRPDGTPWTRDRRLKHDLSRENIVEAARQFDAAHCGFWVQVGHGCSPHLEIATVAAMLDAAPNSLLGFITAEDEDRKEMAYYYEHHIEPILELCLKHHKRLIPRNKDVWWAQWPSDPQMRKLIFNGRYRSVLVPAVEDSNSRCTEVNLAARIGLWADGQVDDWASRSCADWFCTGRAWEWETVMTGHPTLRYYTSQAMLGARVFMLLNGERNRDNEWTRVGAEGAVPFLNLLGKGAITPPRREQLRTLSPIAITLPSVSERFDKHGANGHHEEYWGNDGTDSQAWAFDRLDAYWSMAPLPPTDVATYLWGRTRRDTLHLPHTAPQGLVCLLPDAKPQSNRWSSLWTSDGDLLSKNGQSYSLTDARRIITAELADAAKTFPFKVEGTVFHQIIEQAPDRYVIVLIDPGWVNPTERTVTITAQRPGAWHLTDRLTGKALGDLNQPLNVIVPAGVFRLIEIVR